MKTLILAAGYGTRLYPLTKDTAKALLSLGDCTLLDVVADGLLRAGAQDITVLSNNRFYADFCSWAMSFGSEISVMSDGSDSPENMLGAIGGLIFFYDKKSYSGDLFIIGSDNLFSWELDGFFEFVKKNNVPAVGVYNMKDISVVAEKFGVVEIDPGNNRIISFEEKPSQPRSALIGTCIYYLPASCKKYLDQYAGEGYCKDAIGQFFAWLSAKLDVFAYEFNGVWLDIGHIDSLNEAKELIKNGEINI